MSEKTILPPSVGRLDDVVEAIREGDRERASQLTLDEYCRLERNATRMESQARKIRSAANACLDFQNYVLTSESGWLEARKACGWSGADGFEGPVETLPPVKPALKASELPIGTVMVLGGMEYELEKRCDATGVLAFGFASGVYNFAPPEIQELIDRGVRFEIPEGGA